LGFGRAEAGVVQDREEAAKVATSIDGAGVRDGDEQFAGLTRANDHTAIDDIGDLWRPPPHST
jgi:hypothetical protein